MKRLPVIPILVAMSALVVGAICIDRSRADPPAVGAQRDQVERDLRDSYEAERAEAQQVGDEVARQGALVQRRTAELLVSLREYRRMIETTPGVAPPTANVPGYRSLVGGEGVRIAGQRYIGGDAHRRRVKDYPALYPRRGRGDVYPHRSNPLWITDGVDIAADRCTVALAMDQGLTIGPAEWMVGQGRSVNRVVVSNSLIAHGLGDTGHEDDIDRLDRGLEPHGHSHGCLIRAHSTNVRLYRLVLAHNASRALMHVNPTKGRVTAEAVNCVVYNPSQLVFQLLGDAPAPGTEINLINCLIVEGPDTDWDGWAAGHSARPFDIGTHGVVYMSGNLLLRRDGTLEPIEGRFLTQAERDAMPAEPFELDLPAVEVLPAAALLDALTRDDPVGAGGVYEAWVLESVRDRGGAVIDSNDDLPATLRVNLGIE